MATIQIVIHTDGAAFQDGRAAREVGHLLRKVIEDVQRTPALDVETRRELIDINGNTCGTVVVTL